MRHFISIDSISLITSHTRGKNMIHLLFVNDKQIINNIEIVDDSSTCVKSDYRAITFDVHIRTENETTNKTNGVQLQERRF